MPKKNDNLASLKQAEQAKRMNLAEWRASRLHEETLPSGLPVILRDATMMDLVLTGRLPAAVIDFADAAQKEGRTDIDLKELVSKGADLGVMVNEITKICLVSPMIGAQEDGEHITLAELGGDDKMFIFDWANREVNALHPFRDGEAEPTTTV